MWHAPTKAAASSALTMSSNCSTHGERESATGECWGKSVSARSNIASIPPGGSSAGATSVRSHPVRFASHVPHDTEHDWSM